MEKTIYVMPRRSGKSTTAASEFMKDSKNTMVLCINSAMREAFLTLDKGLSENAYNIRTVNQSLIGFSCKRVIIDEYLFCNNKQLKELYNSIPLICEEVVCFSSINDPISQKYFDFVKSLKQDGFDLKSSKAASFMHEEIVSLGNKTDLVVKQLEYLYYNFITDDDSNLVLRKSLFTTEQTK